jgi:hypothetical protein
MIQILHNLALFWVKNGNFFANFFGENIFKNHNIGPRPLVPADWFVVVPNEAYIGKGGLMVY